MSPHIDFGIIVFILILIGNEMGKTGRKLTDIDEKLEKFRIDMEKTIKHEIEMHEIRTS